MRESWYLLMEAIVANRPDPHCISQQSNLLGLIKMTYEDVMVDIYTLLLIDLTFSMNRTKLPFSIIRACNFVEHRMDDLISSHMRKITTSEGEFWKIFILPVLLLPWYSPPSWSTFTALLQMSMWAIFAGIIRVFLILSVAIPSSSGQSAQLTSGNRLSWRNQKITLFWYYD